jgi:glycosyltransferase involved in cell wall biosynthesis
VAPLRIARGIQNKVLEAMAMARPVVATGQAFEGIDAEAGADLLVAGDAPGFADAVCALLDDPARAAVLGRNARRHLEARYTWERRLEPLDAIIDQSPELC